MTSSSDDEDPLGRIECFNDSQIDTDSADSHVDPVTLTGSRYRYTSQLDPQVHIDLEHRPEKVKSDLAQICLRSEGDIRILW